MNTNTLTRQMAHFDDDSTSFEVLTTFDGKMYVTNQTYDSLQRAGLVDGEPVGLMAPSTYERGLRDINDWVLNFEEPCVIGPVGGKSARDWCSTHREYANEFDSLCPR